MTPSNYHRTATAATLGLIALTGIVTPVHGWITAGEGPFPVEPGSIAVECRRMVSADWCEYEGTVQIAGRESALRAWSAPLTGAPGARIGVGCAGVNPFIVWIAPDSERQRESARATLSVETPNAAASWSIRWIGNVRGGVATLDPNGPAPFAALATLLAVPTAKIRIRHALTGQPIATYGAPPTAPIAPRLAATKCHPHLPPASTR